ncbi:MAG: hypothetical protein B6I28_01085 [Fusobacteriia bacterium 4572_132]|nr:MAG: hypothetical protein B6I28_01085 [Fusobacteriia bacterium 4572_132]
MEVKLMVLYNKPRFGSAIHFSNNITEKEKTLFESIEYSNHEDRRGVEVRIEKARIYLKTYIGGIDEYGRNYRNVIAILFNQELTKAEEIEVFNLLNQIKEQLDKDNFDPKKKYFLDIKKRVKKVKKNHINLYLNIIMFFIIIGESYFYKMKNNSVTEKKGFPKFEEQLKETKTNYERYILFKEFLEKQVLEKSKYLEEAESELYENILKETERDFVIYSNLEDLIEKYLKEEKFEKHRKEVRKIKMKFEKDKKYREKEKIEELITKYNKTLNLESLNELEKECKEKIVKNSSDNKVKTILKKIQKIKRGIDTEVEISIFNKSSILNDKTIFFKIETGKKKYLLEKELGKEKGIYIGSFYHNFKIGEEIKIEIFRYNYNKKKITVYKNILEIKDLNIIQIENNKKMLEFKLQTYQKSDFQIK